MNASGTEISQRGLVSAAILSLHVILVHLLSVGARPPSGFDDAVFEADVLPADRRPVSPPAFPDIVFQTSSPLKLPVLQVVIDAPPGREPPPPSEAEKVD